MWAASRAFVMNGWHGEVDAWVLMYCSRMDCAGRETFGKPGRNFFKGLETQENQEDYWTHGRPRYRNIFLGHPRRLDLWFCRLPSPLLT